MLFTVFSSKYELDGELEDIDPTLLVSNPTISFEKNSLPVLTTSRFYSNRREAGSIVTETPAIWLDFDGTVDIWTACSNIDKLNTNFFAYTTMSHTKEVNKFRIVIPCLYLKPGYYSMFVKYFGLKQKLEFDPSSAQAGRVYFTPATQDPDNYIFVTVNSKTDLDVRSIMDVTNLNTRVSKPVLKENLTLGSLDLACMALARTRENRNNLLYNLAFKYALSDISRATIKWDLREAAMKSGLTQKEAESTIRSAIAKADVTTKGTNKKFQI